MNEAEVLDAVEATFVIVNYKSECFFFGLLVNLAMGYLDSNCNYE